VSLAAILRAQAKPAIQEITELAADFDRTAGEDCSSGRTYATLPERWEASWENNLS